jgi:endonuclease I
MSARKQGRPVDPKSEAQREPWRKLGISRATFYWRKRYGDLPVRKSRARTRVLTINDL